MNNETPWQRKKITRCNLILGSTSIVLSLVFLINHRADYAIVTASIYFALICTTDTLYGKIPNLLNGSLLLAGLALNVSVMGLSGLPFSLSGMALGLALLLLPYLAGGFGAGDVKALAALGALLGPYDLLQIFVYMAFYGGGLALLSNLSNPLLKEKLKSGWVSIKATALTGDCGNLKPDKNKQKQLLTRFPYATAIAFGYYTFLVRGNVL